MPARSRRGTPMLPSRRRSSTSSTIAATPNRRADMPIGGRTSRAALTTMKLLPQTSATTRTDSSATRRSCRGTETPAGWPDGRCDVRESLGRMASAGLRLRPRSAGGGYRLRVMNLDAFLVELQRLLVRLLGQLQPDEEAGQ